MCESYEVFVLTESGLLRMWKCKFAIQITHRVFQKKSWTIVIRPHLAKRFFTGARETREIGNSFHGLLPALSGSDCLPSH